VRLLYYLRTGYWHCGERVNPDFPDEYFQNHLKAYQFFLQFADHQTVLDVGCGTGYGTALLASVAKRAVGIDISHQAIRFAKSRYKGKNLAFTVMDAEKLAFADASFGLAVSNENLEHLRDQACHLQELQRVLGPRGVCIIATPNPEVTVGMSPFHTKENTYQELMALLRERFEEVCIVENSLPPATGEARSASARRRAAGHRGLDPSNGLRIFGRALDTTFLSNTHSFFCFARNRPC
jgi:SAM-dependent methyltransferase